MLEKVFACLFLFLFSPLFILIAFFIFIEDGLPVFFIQKRIGIDYSYFFFYKFRSMKRNTPNLATHLLVNPEKYILKTGRILRLTSLDELPNLINILKGDIVFVGPRPALYNQNDLMDLRIENGVHKLKPGLTGWAQINGRDDISLQEKVALESVYLKNKSFWFDFRILIRTITMVIKSNGVKY